MGIRKLVLGFVIAGLCSPAQATPLVRETGDALRGIPLARLIGSLERLGEWPLLSGGQVRLDQIMTHGGGECGVSGLDDANICGRFTLLVSANGETSVPVGFVLFRGPETLGWKVPKGAKPRSDYGKFSIPLSACEMKKTSKGTGWKGTSYILHVGQNTWTDEHVFTADLEKLPGERPDCAN